MKRCGAGQGGVVQAGCALVQLHRIRWLHRVYSGGVKALVVLCHFGLKQRGWQRQLVQSRGPRGSQFRGPCTLFYTTEQWTAPEDLSVPRHITPHTPAAISAPYCVYYIKPLNLRYCR